jgi:prevent-host-death family protein
MQITNISDAKASLSKLIEQVQTGKSVIIGEAGKPVAMLVPYDLNKAPRELSSSWKGKVTMADDFDVYQIRS